MSFTRSLASFHSTMCFVVVCCKAKEREKCERERKEQAEEKRMRSGVNVERAAQTTSPSDK